MTHDEARKVRIDRVQRYVDLPRAELIFKAKMAVSAARAWRVLIGPRTPFGHAARERCLLTAATYRRALARQCGLNPQPFGVYSVTHDEARKVRKERIRKDEFNAADPAHFKLQSRGGAWRYYRKVGP